jgi:transcriptional regulator with XRE-family HTH domain
MNSLREERIAKGITQVMLEEMTGITQEQISIIERGKVKPTKSSRDRIEGALRAKIDWSAMSKIKIKGDYREAERLVQKLIGLILGLNEKDKNAIALLLSKYL